MGRSRMLVAFALLAVVLFLAGCKGRGRGTADTFAPEILNVQPTGAVTMSSPTISLQTNEAAVCRYSLDSASGFGQMASLENTGSTLHSHTFENVADGSYTIFLKCSDQQGNVNQAPYGLSYTVKTGTQAQDTAPPQIFNQQPTGTITTSSVTVSVETDEAAECRYSLSPDAAFESMREMDSSGSTAHSQRISRIPDGDYRAYVKCRDSAGNVNAAAFQLSLTVNAQKEPPVPEPEPTPVPNVTINPVPNVTITAGADRYGINTGILVTEEPYFDRAISKAASVGVGWIRIGNDWSDLEPTDNQWTFKVADSFIDTARSSGLNVVYTFDPDLNGKFCSVSRGGKLGMQTTLPACTDEQLRDYINQIVTRYKGKVAYYEVGNEPDLRGTWRDYPNEYAHALEVAYPAMKAADPDAKLLIGGLAMGGGQSSSLGYLDTLIAKGALNNFDIFNYHTYDKKDGVTSQYNELKAKVGSKPIWITEVGYPSSVADQEKYRSSYPYSSGEDGQEEYLREILPHILSLGVEKVFWYTSADVPRDHSSFCTYGLFYIPEKQCMTLSESEGRKIDGELTEKKAFQAYKEITAEAG